MSSAKETAEALRTIFEPMVQQIQTEVDQCQREVFKLRQEVHAKQDNLTWAARRLRELADSLERVAQGPPEGLK